MSADSVILEPAGGPVLRLDFEMTLAEHSAVAQQLWWPSRHPRFMASCGVFLVALGAFTAGSDLASANPANSWSVSFPSIYLMLMGWILAVSHGSYPRLKMTPSRGVSHTQLELDCDGIRGLFEHPSGWHKEPEVKHLNYTWRKVRKIHRPPDYFVLEFHGGGTVTIPEREFATHDDLRQCLAWAEGGLAEQRKKPVVRHAVQFVEGE